MQLLFDYPCYFVVLCLLAGAGCSAALYWRTKKQFDQDTPRWVRLLLPLLRGAVVSVIALLLMAPMIKRHTHSQEQPIVVLAQDVSTSVDSAQAHLLDEIIPQLQKHCQVVVDTFGGKTTDIAAELASIADRFAGRNLGAVVLSSDGMYNQGANPLNDCAQCAAPIYVLALGDTTQRRDASITNLRYNQMAYLGNQFPVEVVVQAHLLKGKRATLSISQNGTRLCSKEIFYGDNPTTIAETLILTAQKSGVQHYTVSITPCEGEYSIANNTRTMAVEVIDGHQKIAILAAAPHPDISALRQSIERNPNYEVQVSVLDNTVSTVWLKDCSLLILHNLPTATQSLGQIVSLHLPTIYVVGSQTDLARFNALHSGMEVMAKSHKIDEVTASTNNSFSLFNINSDICSHLEQMPPLNAPFGTYRISGNTQTLFYARVGQVSSDRPLIAFSQQDGVRCSFIVGEGLWRWRLQDYLMNGSHVDFDQLVEKMVVYTSLSAAKERFRIVHQHIYQEGEPVAIEAELYNDNFEPINTPDVQIKISRSTDSLSDGKAPSHHSQTYTFNRSASGYMLRLESLAPGQYSFHASTTFNGKQYKASGSFSVEQLDLEQLNHVADHALLNTMAQTTGGAMLLPDELNQLPKLLADRPDLKPVLYPHIRYTQMLDLPLLFLLIILLLAAEWGLRKYYLN